MAINSGYNIYKDKISYGGVLQDYRSKFFNPELFFNKSQFLDGNVATWYNVIMPTLTTTDQTDSGCAGTRSIACLETDTVSIKLDKRIDQGFKLFQCAANKIDPNLANIHFARIEKEYARILTKEGLNNIATVATSYIATTETNVLDVIENMINPFLEKGYARQDITIVVNSAIDSSIRKMGLSCCEPNATSQSFISKLDVSVVVVPSDLLPTGVSAIAYLKPYALYGVSCERAEIYQGTEFQLRGWVVYDKYEEYTLQYLPDTENKFLAYKWDGVLI